MTAPGGSAGSPSVLVVVSNTYRRGSEIAGAALADWLRRNDIAAGLVALTAGTGPEITGVDAVLGRSSTGWSTLRALRRVARRYDIVIAYGAQTYPMSAMALLGTRPLLVHRYIGDPVYWEGGWFRRWRMRWVFGRAAGVVALWPGAANSLATLYRLPAERAVAIPNGRDDARFRPPTPDERGQARATFGFDDDAWVVAVIGALEPEKRVERAIAAVATIPQAHLLAVGEGSEQERLEALAAAGRVTFVGGVDDVRPALWAADVLVSTSETEGMAGVIVEAALCGVPVVTTAVGAAADGELDDIAHLVPAEATTAEIATAITAAIGTPPAPAAATDRFTWPVIGEQWRRYLESLVVE